MPKIKFHKIAAVAVLVVSALWIATGEFSAVGSAAVEKPTAKAAEAEQPKAIVRTVAVVTPPHVNHARAIRMSGQTGADKRADLAVRANGIIGKLPVSQGDRVKTGDLILMLDAEEKTAMVETGKSLLAQREAEAAAAQRLMKSGAMAKLSVDNAVSALASARSTLELAEAELTRNEVLAPFDGVVDRVTVEQGSSVLQGTAVATLLKLDPIVARGEVSEQDLRYISVGEPAEIRLVSGEMVTGKVRYLSRDATAMTRTFRVEVAIPNPKGDIPAGMTAEITLRAGGVDAVILPRSVVTLSASGDLGIRAVDPKNVVTFFPVDLVDDTPTGLVLGGIPADARIIVAGQDLVTEGDTVDPVAADPALIKKLVGEVAAATP